METAKLATPFDPTLDSASGLREDAPVAGSHRAVALVQGSTPELKAETNELLRDRLRIASLLLFGGFLTFLIRRLFF